jgi:general secretion pathway protein K
MHCRRCNRRGEAGAALIVALLVFALCTALVVAMKAEFTRFYQRSANLFLAEQAQAYLRGAEDLASLALLIDYDADKDLDQPRDDLDEVWAQPTAPYPLDEGGWLAGELVDLQGRFNLNYLAQAASGEEGAPGYTPAQAQFIRLLQALGEPAIGEQEAIRITRSIGDWLDADSVPAPDGAEDDYYYSRAPAYRTANRAMASVSELRAVAGITPQLYAALQPWVSVWPRTPAPLNIHTAPAMVLRSINADDDLSPLSEADGQALVEQRQATAFASVDDFLDNPVFAGKGDQMSEVKTLLGETSSYFLLDAKVEVADRNLRLYSVLERKRRQVTAIVRTGGSL